MASFTPLSCRRVLFSLLCFVSLLRAEPLSKKTDIDFYREVPSRNLHALAARADGRLVSGPTLTELAGTAPAELLWCLVPAADGKWLLGTGADGKIFEATLDLAKNTYATREVVKLDDPQVFAVARLPDGTILAGTSPKGGLCLIRDGKLVSRVALPVDSIFDLLLLPDAQTSTLNAQPPSPQALVSTGNPGRVYRIDVAKFATAGQIADKVSDTKILAERGVTLFGEIRDRNARRLARLADGRIILGSAPKGNIYAFAPEGGAPVILQENREAEITDLLPQPNGDFYASVVFSGTAGESRINSPAKSAAPTPGAKDTGSDLPPPAPPERFSGRTALWWFPVSGFPELLTSRSSATAYRLARHGDVLFAAGGELGEVLAYDLGTRLALTFAGSTSAQLNGLAPVAGSPDKFIALRNNAPGLALIDFAATAPREAETRRIDLSAAAQFGAVRINRLRELSASALTLELKTSNGSDEVEGWTPWTALPPGDSAWQASALRGRYVKFRLRAPAETPAALEIDKPTLFYLSQNRRPLLTEFRFITPGYGLVPAVDSPPSPIATLSQLIQAASKEDEPKRKGNFLNSQIVPAPGTQIAFWTVTDPDSDNVLCTFSIRRDGDTAWTDLAVATRDSYVQFDTAHLADGVYFTRLVATEAAPRPSADRLTVTFETDDLVVDHTAPILLEATAKRVGEKLVFSVHGRDALSLLDSIEVTLNNGVHETVEQPVDGIRDGREETFVLELPLTRVTGATSAEIILYDAVGNSVARRLTW